VSNSTAMTSVAVNRGEHFSGRAEKILPMTIPLDGRALIFGPGPGLGGPPSHFIV
jgi:hypothetical protein